MELPVLVQAVVGKGFVATVGSPFNWTAEGATPDEALAKLQGEVNRNTSNGSRITTVQVKNSNPWLECIGTWDPNDPVIQEFEKYVEEYRQAIDDDPNSF